jgi:hypothetical protein
VHSANDVICGDAQRRLFERLYQQPGAFSKFTPIYRSDAKLTYHLRSESPNREAILQVWLLEEDDRARVLYGPYGIKPDSHFHRLWPYGSRYVTYNTELLRAHEVRVPAILLADESRDILPHAYVVFEQLDGEPWDRHRDSLSEAELTGFHARTGDALGRFHALERAWAGPPAHQQDDGPGCAELCLEQVGFNVENARNTSVLHARRSQILGTMQSLAGAFEKRQVFHATHGDMLPGHLLVDSQGQIWLIDVENMKFFDLEYEACRFWLTALDLTSSAFRDAYGRRINHPLDEGRIKFYEIYWLVSWITYLNKNLEAAGPGAQERLEESRMGIERTLEARLLA